MRNKEFFEFDWGTILCEDCADGYDEAEVFLEEGPIQCDYCLYQNEAYEIMGWDHNGIWHDWWEKNERS